MSYQPKRSEIYSLQLKINMGQLFLIVNENDVYNAYISSVNKPNSETPNNYLYIKNNTFYSGSTSNSPKMPLIMPNYIYVIIIPTNIYSAQFKSMVYLVGNKECIGETEFKNNKLYEWYMSNYSSNSKHNIILNLINNKANNLLNKPETIINFPDSGLWDSGQQYDYPVTEPIKSENIIELINNNTIQLKLLKDEIELLKLEMKDREKEYQQNLKNSKEMHEDVDKLKQKFTELDIFKTNIEDIKNECCYSDSEY